MSYGTLVTLPSGTWISDGFAGLSVHLMNRMACLRVGTLFWKHLVLFDLCSCRMVLMMKSLILAMATSASSLGQVWGQLDGSVFEVLFRKFAEEAQDMLP